MKLLLVEDNPMLVSELEKQLKQAGYVTDITDKAVEADYLVKETQYDCVILDIGLPAGNGLNYSKAGVIKALALLLLC